jgi:Fe-Mn family superoxide dismutase
MELNLIELPYNYDSLEPYISSETLKTHYEGHHAGYVKKFNELVASKSQDIRSLNFNYNGSLLHDLYWQSLNPLQQKIGPKLGTLIKSKYGSFPIFISKLIKCCKSHQGSGWTLLLQNQQGNLFIKNIPNHDFQKIGDQFNILLVLDAWEHAYYLDYKNNKKLFFEKLVNIIDWQAAESRVI